MNLEEIEDDIRKRVVLTGRIVLGSILASLLMFCLLLGTYFMESMDSEIAAAGYQMRLFVLSNTENFEMGNDKALKKAAWNLAKTPLVSHVLIYDQHGRVMVWVVSPSYGDVNDTENLDASELLTVQTKKKIILPTSGSDLIPMELPTGRTIYRSYTPIRKGTTRLGEVEMGFFKSELIDRSLHRLRIPGAVAAGCTLLLIPLVSVYVRRWERAKTVEFTELFKTHFEKVVGDYERQLAMIKRERENKDVDGTSFFNIMEAVRDISAAADTAQFIRRSVLSSVRLFRCKIVSFYLYRAADGKEPVWELSGKYDGKGYAHDLKETLDPGSHPRLKEALSVGATELLQGYPVESSQAMLIAVTADKPLGVILLQNKVGSFDSKDILSARIFAGFLPNLLAWHVK